MVQKRVNLSKVYWCVINLQIGVQSGTLCTQEPAVPAKLCQDVTKLGFILVPSYCMCLAPSPRGAEYVLGSQPGVLSPPGGEKPLR